MARKAKKAALPKERSFHAASLFDPSSPFRCKKMVEKKDKIHRKRKHKGKDV